ncbi:hypothetical protein [Nocardia tengchongensis]|uniref:hypothetical protein n=1 Tax=Nocardia tengchongensis TaxID=2055889 RepID=UPI0036489091
MGDVNYSCEGVLRSSTTVSDRLIEAFKDNCGDEGFTVTDDGIELNLTTTGLEGGDYIAPLDDTLCALRDTGIAGDLNGVIVVHAESSYDAQIWRRVIAHNRLLYPDFEFDPREPRGATMSAFTALRATPLASFYLPEPAAAGPFTSCGELLDRLADLARGHSAARSGSSAALRRLAKQIIWTTRLSGALADPVIADQIIRATDRDTTVAEEIRAAVADIDPAFAARVEVLTAALAQGHAHALARYTGKGPRIVELATDPADFAQWIVAAARSHGVDATATFTSIQ